MPTRLNVPLPLIIVVGSLALAAVVAMVFMRRRWRHADLRPELAAVPLVVDDVVKTYRDGFRAVDGISFRAEAGQVVGLLGPNGAGKTTAMRMFVGLIRPDSGSIFVNGLPVHAGADVLGSVGAFIEGPGFPPHLTGMQNLQRVLGGHRPAVGRSAPGRGAGDRRSRRRRSTGGSAATATACGSGSGIAQAMLGLPPLLVLDEPTNGLDPPQIKAMRAVLADYAAAGRTVVISSHLLSEVEQHLQPRGRDGQGKGRPDRCRCRPGGERHRHPDRSRRRRPGRGGPASAGRPRHPGRAGGPDPAGGRRPAAVEIVAGLVGDGYRVESVDGHRQLEEVFMSLASAPAEPEDRRCLSRSRAGP